MRRVIRKHLVDFIADRRHLRRRPGRGAIHPHRTSGCASRVVEDKPFKVKVELPDAQAVQPGQGQTVRTAGVEIGQIGEVELEDGKAVVTLELEKKYEGYVKRDATVLLRTKTGPEGHVRRGGSRHRQADPGERPRPGAATRRPTSIPTRSSPRSTPTRATTSSCSCRAPARGSKGRGSDLRETFARLGPLNRDLDRVTASVARRRKNLSRLVNRYGLLTRRSSARRTARSCGWCAPRTRSSRRSPRRTPDLRGGAAAPVARCARPRRTLAKVDTFSDRLGPALESLRPPIRRLADRQPRGAAARARGHAADREPDPPVRADRPALHARPRRRRRATCRRPPRPHDRRSTSSTGSSTSARSTRVAPRA